MFTTSKGWLPSLGSVHLSNICIWYPFIWAPRYRMLSFPPARPYLDDDSCSASEGCCVGREMGGAGWPDWFVIGSSIMYSRSPMYGQNDWPSYRFKSLVAFLWSYSYSYSAFKPFPYYFLMYVLLLLSYVCMYACMYVCIMCVCVCLCVCVLAGLVESVVAAACSRVGQRVLHLDRYL